MNEVTLRKTVFTYKNSFSEAYKNKDELHLFMS